MYASHCQIIKDITGSSRTHKIATITDRNTSSTNVSATSLVHLF